MTSRPFTKGLSDAIVATEIVAVLSRADNNNRALLVPDPLDRPQTMPMYTVTTQGGSLSNDAKVELAAKLTALHCEMSGVPKNWVHVVFHDYTAGSGFTAGEPAATVALALLIRTGRPSEYKRELLKRLWGLLQSATGAPDDQIVIGIQEVPASQAMEMGEIMPDVAGHSAPSD